MMKNKIFSFLFFLSLALVGVALILYVRDAILAKQRELLYQKQRVDQLKHVNHIEQQTYIKGPGYQMGAGECTSAGPGEPLICDKPVIYLYPTKEMKVIVRLEYAGDITVSYPAYDNELKGWQVDAFPGGKLINLSDNQEYSYLFWEGGKVNVQYDLSEGFVVEGEKSDAFLKEKLSEMGLTPREYNEFIVYWYPRLKQNKYNLIHFDNEEYEKIAKLTVTPKPDSLLRIFMVYKLLLSRVELKPQKINPFHRNGFTVIEWGGTEITGGNESSSVE